MINEEAVKACGESMNKARAICTLRLGLGALLIKYKDDDYASGEYARSQVRIANEFLDSLEASR